MNPQDYSRRTTYRPPAPWYRRLNRIGVPLLSLGLGPSDAVVLEVRGRTTGKRRRLPILRTSHDGADYLVALAGESEWVRNVRAAGGRAAIRRLGTRPVVLVEVPPEERADVIAAYLRAASDRSGSTSGAKQARFYFGLGPDASADDIRALVDYYPVFRIDYTDREI